MLTDTNFQVHEQQCLKVTQHSVMNWCSDSIVLPSWWVAPTCNTNDVFAYPLSIICSVNVLYFLKFCPVFSYVSAICTAINSHYFIISDILLCLGWNEGKDKCTRGRAVICWGEISWWDKWLGSNAFIWNATAQGREPTTRIDNMWTGRWSGQSDDESEGIQVGDHFSGKNSCRSVSLSTLNTARQRSILIICNKNQWKSTFINCIDNK